MTQEKLFLDTAFIQALLNPRDEHHAKAKSLFPWVRTASKVLTTEAVLVEVGNALSALNRQGAAKFINQCYSTQNIKVVSVNTGLLTRALDLYQKRLDKSWGLTDCISFVVMNDNDIVSALTTDRHFTQAGFRTLMMD